MLKREPVVLSQLLALVPFLAAAAAAFGLPLTEEQVRALVVAAAGLTLLASLAAAVWARARVTPDGLEVAVHDVIGAVHGALTEFYWPGPDAAAPDSTPGTDSGPLVPAKVSRDEAGGWSAQVQPGTDVGAVALARAGSATYIPPQRRPRSESAHE